MKEYDVFNGDADGLCALIQWRLAKPAATELVTGIKRDINLMQKLPATEANKINVFDISLDKNRAELNQQLDLGGHVIYFDHHFAGEIPESDLLNTYIDTKPDTCTSLIVNQYLKNAFPAWAVVGAYGDNMFAQADFLADQLDLTEGDREKLKSLGICLNYNGYGSSLEDLHFTPSFLFNELKAFKTPFEFIEKKTDLFNALEKAYEEDMTSAKQVSLEIENDDVALLVFPGEVWARRVSGVYANDLANDFPNRAHAILTEKVDTYLVSVRAPLNRREGADDLCRQFPSGGGRKAAAGINDLPKEDLDKFTEAFKQQFAICNRGKSAV
jgi:oligoribonuclease NrnB/cAMP/cGMP phosphodiesterase (DHH superfamily)